MNRIAPEGPIDLARLKALIAEHDTQALAEHPSDPQQQAGGTVREYVGDKVVVVIRTAAPGCSDSNLLMAGSGPPRRMLR